MKWGLIRPWAFWPQNLSFPVSRNLSYSSSPPEEAIVLPTIIDWESRTKMTRGRLELVLERICMAPWAIWYNCWSTNRILASECFSSTETMAESWRVLRVQRIPPAIGTPKCSSYIAGMLGINVATYNWKFMRTYRIIGKINFPH